MANLWVQLKNFETIRCLLADTSKSVQEFVAAKG